jgi:putative redox protein
MGLRARAHAVPGTLRQSVLVGGRHRLVTDQPEPHGGDDLGPSPHELLPAGLAACTVWALVSHARTKGWELGEVAVDVDYDHRSTPRHMDVTVRLGGDLSPEQLERLHKVAAACPLRRSIEAGITFDERIELAPRAA